MTVVELTEATFDEVVGSGPGPVLVDVAAEWCPPCRQMEPILEELAVEEGGALVVASIDADAHPEVARRLGVMSFPTFVVFVEGEERGRFVGARGKGRLREDLRAVLG
jgi:thioredoxin 1